MNKYKNLFFDLDRTLWDYKANSEQTLKELLLKYTPELKHRVNEFINVFYEVNEALWFKYRNGEITKSFLSDTRFIEVYKRFNFDAKPFSKRISKDYIVESPKKSKLFPGAESVLKTLKERGYRLFLLSNGFLEVQKVKIKKSNIEQYFEEMITSEEAMYQKPDPEIFKYALLKVSAKKNQSIMIGDDLESDIAGAQKFGMDTVLFNPAKISHSAQPTFEINKLSELLKIFI